MAVSIPESEGLSKIWMRSDYMASITGDRAKDMASHRKFYRQFVSKRTIEYVVRSVGRARLLAVPPEDEHLHAIPCNPVWDRVAYRGLPLAMPFSVTGLCGAMADYVCVAKEAARIWLDQQRNLNLNSDETKHENQSHTP